MAHLRPVGLFMIVMYVTVCGAIGFFAISTIITEKLGLPREGVAPNRHVIGMSIVILLPLLSCLGPRKKKALSEKPSAEQGEDDQASAAMKSKS